MTTADRDWLDKQIFDFIASRGVSWVFGADIAEHFKGTVLVTVPVRFETPEETLGRIGENLDRLATQGWIEAWPKCPSGASWALTPYAAASLGFELDPAGKKWVRAGKITVRVRITDGAGEARVVAGGCSSMNSIQIKKYRPNSCNQVILSECDLEGGRGLDGHIDGNQYEPSDFLEAYESIIDDSNYSDPVSGSRYQKTRDDYAEVPIPAPTRFLGADDAWPIPGQRREYGPPEGQPARPGRCQECEEMAPGFPATYCLCCGAHSFDYLIPSIDRLDDRRLLWEAIKQRKRRKKARAEAKRIKRGPGRPRKNQGET